MKASSSPLRAIHIKGKDLNNARMVEFIKIWHRGEFDSRLDAYDKHN